MKRLLCVTMILGLAISASAAWNMVVNTTVTPPRIVYFSHDADSVDVGTPFTLTKYADELTAARAAATLVKAGAVVPEGLVLPVDNLDRYVAENVFLLICDQLAGRNTHTALTVRQVGLALLQVKAADPVTFEKLRDGLNALDSELTAYDPKWRESCVWHSETLAVAGAAEYLGALR